MNANSATLQGKGSPAHIIRPVERKLVPLDRLKPAQHNPSNRVALKVLSSLIDSMDRIGLLHPVTVTRDWTFIDGHRRVAAARHLGWLDIECNLVELDPAEVYASVNATPRKLSGTDSLSVWLVNSRAVSDAQSKQFKAMTDTIGIQAVRRLASAGYSLQLYLLARRIARYCDEDNRDTVRAVLTWLCEVARVGQVRKAIEAGESPALIMRAVRTNKPVHFRLTIDEERIDS